ncbi:MAG: glycoside hydrolase, partial [Thermoplasmata archaeon]|nr:glycoside hydrolase [Thermoplasmata archaeon]
MRCSSLPVLALTLLLALPPALGATSHMNLAFFVNEIPDSEDGGFEPHVIVGPGPDGTGEVLYIDSPNGLASQLSGNLWRSDDGGNTWEIKPKDFGNMGASGDSYTAVASDGTLYFTDLYGVTVTIDVSTDGGDSWFQNPWGGSRIGDDRQWFVMGPTVDGLPGMRDQTLYLSYNSLDGLVVDRYSFDPYAIIKVPGPPVTNNVYARDYFAVDQNDGTVYLPNYEGDSVALYRSSDGGVTWDALTVATGTGDVQHIFIGADVDAAGNLYLVWCDQRNVTLAVSTDRGDSWAFHSVTDTPGTRVLPWITAGDAGMVGLNWVETSDVGDCNELDSNWSVLAAVCVNATAPDPQFIVTPVLE